MVLELATTLLSFDAYHRSTHANDCMLVTGRDVFRLRYEGALTGFAGEKVIVRGCLEKGSGTIHVASIRLAGSRSARQG